MVDADGDSGRWKVDGGWWTVNGGWRTVDDRQRFTWQDAFHDSYLLLPPQAYRVLLLSQG